MVNDEILYIASLSCRTGLQAGALHLDGEYHNDPNIIDLELRGDAPGRSDDLLRSDCHRAPFEGEIFATNVLAEHRRQCNAPLPQMIGNRHRRRLILKG